MFLEKKKKILDGSKHMFATLCADGEEKYVLPKCHPETNRPRENHVSVCAKRDAKPHTVLCSYTIAQTLEAVRNYAVVIKTGSSRKSQKYLSRTNTYYFDNITYYRS